MDMQGFPLYAVDPEYPDTVYVVVGWLHGRMPKLVPLTHGARGGQATREPGEDRTYRFTTTDPTEPANPILVDAASRNLADLRQRLTVLAQDAYRFLWNGEQVASKILEELNK